MPAVRVYCPACDAELEVDERHVGQEVECGNCRQVFIIEKRAHRPDRTRRAVVDDDYPVRRPGGGDNTVAVVALILGILSFPLVCCCAYLGVPVQIGGIVCGSIGLRNPNGRGMAVAGLILSLVALVLTIGVLAVGFGLRQFR